MTRLMNKKNELLAQGDRLLKPLGMYPVDVEVESSRSRPLVRFFVANLDQSEVTVGACAKANRALESYLDETLQFGEEYAMEVHSPGVDRRLARPADFQRFVGKEVRLKLNREIDGRKKFTGVINEADDQKIVFVTDGESLEIQYEDISRGNVVYDFSKVEGR